jgi:ribonuclease Z
VIDIVFLGTGSMMPTAERWLSSLLMRVDGSLILLDCGEGVQVPWRQTGWGFKRLDLICVSHWHADHVAGLPGILHALALAGREDPLTVIGPVGTRDTVTTLRPLAPILPYSLVSADIANGQEWRHGPLQISVRRGDHRVPVLVYRFDLPRKPAFLVDRAIAQSVPRDHWSRLAEGEDIQSWRAADFLGQPRKGISIGFMTDTRPTESARELLDGVDLLISEGTYGDEADLANAVQNKHMTFREAATFAREARVGRLVLTHFSPKINDPAEWLGAARDIFPKTDVAIGGYALTLKFSDDRSG